MRASAQAASHAIATCMRISHPGVLESALAATFGERWDTGMLLLIDVWPVLGAHVQPACSD